MLAYRNEMATYLSLGILLGDDLVAHGDVRPGLVDWMEETTMWSEENDPANDDTRLTARIKTEAFSADLEISVDLASEYDFLPRTVTVKFVDTDTLHQRMRVTKYQTVGPDSCPLPVEGTHESFYREAVLPNGLARADYDKMNAQQRASVDPLVTWKSVPLTAPVVIEVDVGSLKINLPVTADDFQIDYPADARVYDGLQDRTLLGGTTPIEDDEPSLPIERPRSSLKGVWIVIVANALFLGLVIIYKGISRIRNAMQQSRVARGERS